MDTHVCPLQEHRRALEFSRFRVRYHQIPLCSLSPVLSQPCCCGTISVDCWFIKQQNEQDRERVCVCARSGIHQQTNATRPYSPNLSTGEQSIILFMLRMTKPSFSQLPRRANTAAAAHLHTALTCAFQTCGLQEGRIISRGIGWAALSSRDLSSHPDRDIIMESTSPRSDQTLCPGLIFRKPQNHGAQGAIRTSVRSWLLAVGTEPTTQLPFPSLICSFSKIRAGWGPSSSLYPPRPPLGPPLVLHRSSSHNCELSLSPRKQSPPAAGGFSSKM